MLGSRSKSGGILIKTKQMQAWVSSQKQGAVTSPSKGAIDEHTAKGIRALQQSRDLSEARTDRPCQDGQMHKTRLGIGLRHQPFLRSPRLLLISVP